MPREKETLHEIGSLAFSVETGVMKFLRVDLIAALSFLLILWTIDASSAWAEGGNTTEIGNDGLEEPVALPSIGKSLERMARGMVENGGAYSRGSGLYR